MEHIMDHGDNIISKLWMNFRYAGRRLGQNPGFTGIAVLSLALGIGANTAIFSLVNAIVLREFPFKATEQLVNIYMTTRNTLTLLFPTQISKICGTEPRTSSRVSALRGWFSFKPTEPEVSRPFRGSRDRQLFPVARYRGRSGEDLLPEDDLTRALTRW